ncbi:SMP-30/gluconolactonase/LRE family protein [Amycolatopsis sp. K13G38]|uniref:SMP-30/gluconolactonase/LRE family protein n=1 Tax=Amycolatopsis acididurans TaxID=2724524 RepID=A0ABX1IVY9_9PSEU|nr:SMP-30/gluconolactonase/LRE family protein [Amycolatopsis acididurans]NKQ51647.1 SMP-30/gluconolactonase/LRE family protein [Amycolatopsis acididurans]
MTAAPALVATGLRFPEGPSYLGEGAVAVVEMKGEALSRVAPDGTVTPLGDCGGAPNGRVLGAGGELYVANNGGLSIEGRGYWHAPRQFDGHVQRVDADGTVTAVGGTLPGPAPHRPNDLCFGPDGTLYVTDSGNWEDMRNIRPGTVVAIGPDGTQLGSAEVPAMPNGVAFGPDGRLYLAQSLTRKVLAFDVTGGDFGDPETVLTLPTGSPDGICFDGDGTLYVCGSVGNAIFVYSGAELKETIETGAGTQPTNCCTGDDGRLYVTFSLTGQLVAFDLGLTPLEPHTGTITAREDS